MGNGCKSKRSVFLNENRREVTQRVWQNEEVKAAVKRKEALGKELLGVRDEDAKE